MPRAGLVEAIVRGDRSTWAVIGALWAVAAIVVVAQRRDPAARFVRVLGPLLVATSTSLAGLGLSAGLAVPRLRWRPASDAALVVERGETWRRLRGPAVEILVGGAPEVALPTIDADGAWVLFGMLSGKPIPGLSPAPAKPPGAGAARLCSLEAESEACRAWPASWPDPENGPHLSELLWSRDGSPSSLAYDVESGLFLRDASAPPGRGPLEVVGRISNEASREGTTALFTLRRLVDGQLQAVRVVATPSGESLEFRLQRAQASLTLANDVFRYFAQPVLLAASFAAPVAILAFLLAPALFAARLRRAVRREGDRAIRLFPVATPARGGSSLATVTEDATLGDVPLARGACVDLCVSDGRPVTSRAWLELVRTEDERGPDGAPYRGSVRLGRLVPADPEPFRSAARTWIYGLAHPLAIFVAGVAAVTPAIVAIAAIIAAR